MNRMVSESNFFRNQILNIQNGNEKKKKVGMSHKVRQIRIRKNDIVILHGKGLLNFNFIPLDSFKILFHRKSLRTFML